MINRNNKKGFTIVELVIVIAVIAILAAVLIPTFSGIIKKANMSADEQAIRQMNTALAMYEAENGKIKDLITAKKALDEALVNVEDGLVPVTQGYAFYWDSTKNEVVLVSSEDEIKDGWVILTSNNFGTLVKVDSVDALKDAIANSSNKKPSLIKLTDNLTLTENLSVKNGNVVTLDLNGKTLTTNVQFAVGANSVLTIKDGKVVNENAAKITLYNAGGTLALDNVEVESPANSIWPAIYVYGICDTSIKDSKITSASEWGIGTNSTNVTADGARVTIENSTISATTKPLFCSINANFVANNSTFTVTGSEGNAVTLKDGKHEFNNCKFVSPADGSAIFFVDGAAGYSGEVSAKFNGCEHYNGETKVAKVAIGHGALGAKATVTIDGEYTVTKKADGSTGSLSINGTAITLN